LPAVRQSGLGGETLFPAIDHPVVVDELLGRCLGDPEFAREMLDGFVKSCPGSIEEFGESIDAGASQDLARQIHRMKGTAATLAARPLHKLLEDMESLVLAGNPSESLRNRLDDIAADVDRLTLYVANLEFGFPRENG
jgi:HPt (histidine-containing phosphotransfer) domain-containing protein